ncbi:MAG: PLD nuclease N-terminal domain-containing protein [Verrucomicrobia bacterium]|nr:PLD nuclease N-terminal domain-containing protein [Verrucomicrobiota bacterium]MCG2681660.1 PLD nuclease N-terminal domain-containing protein [Kiritimatiellia bacterium]MBU4248113.1 PLD nuclease N-terminal domain-containing protein [Verrucomicrobiota bacterium]MBU4290789.1 PLD nuclease N-terminal domain-containing protein [Verrucomicrobiota bacterium]MBU4429736.1 PLD nuclease N-terminal domain-containing protein [Verrucomicrobiota bacterium]
MFPLSIVLFWLISVLIGLIALGFWVWALIDCLLRSDESYEKMFGTISPKIVWALIIFFGQFIGALIYLFVAGTRKNPKRAVVKIDPAGTEEGKRILQMIADGKVTPGEGQRLLLALGKKEMEQAGLQSASMPKAFKIGCGICVVILILGFLLCLAFFLSLSRSVTERDIIKQIQNESVLHTVPEPVHLQDSSIKETK